MKILQVIDKLNCGGAEKICIELCNLLYNNNNSVAILCYEGKGELDFLLNSNIYIEKCFRSSKYNIIDAFKISKVLKKYDIIHVHMRHNYRYIQLIAKLFNVKAKIILHDHSSQLTRVPLFLNSFLKPSFYIGVCEELTDWAKNKLKVDSDAVFLLGNVISQYKQEASKKYKNEGFVIIGNIKPNKNQLFAIQLMPYFKENLTIIGKVQDIGYFDLIKHEIGQLGLSKRVHFIHDELNVQRKLGNYKLALQTSKLESGPLVLIEFLAQDIPFIAFKTGQVSDLLEKELPQLFMDDFNQEKWILAKNSALNAEFNFQELYLKYFDSNKYLNKCLKIYTKIENS